VGVEAKAAALVRAYCAVADEDWLLFSFHLLQLHHFLPYYQEDGRDPVTMVEDIIKRAMMDQLPPGDPRVLAAMAIGVITQTAQNKAYGRLGDDALSAHAPLMTAAVKAVLSRQPSGRRFWRPSPTIKESRTCAARCSTPTTGSCRSSTACRPRSRPCCRAQAVAFALRLYSQRMLWALARSPA
jgi:hypothetical protein